MANEEHLAILRQGVEVWNEWRMKNLHTKIDLKEADLSEADLKEVDFRRLDLRRVNFSKANLTGAILIEADLCGANLTRAILIGTDLRGVYLGKANLSGADFSSADLKRAYLKNLDIKSVNLTRANLSEANLGETNLSEARLKKANLSEADFNAANLSRSDLREANLSRANLSGADLSRADLSRATLSISSALNTNFYQATLTGACIQDWHINSATNLIDVICDYVYLAEGKQERRPSDINKNFAPGEFTKLFQKAQETVDLIFRDGINWLVFLTSFQKLQIKCGGEELSIQAIENKNDGAFVIRVNVSSNANKAEIEKYLKQEYDLALKTVEEKYCIQLQAKNEQIAVYRQQSADLMEIAKLMASRPISNVIEVTAKAESESASEAAKKISNYSMQNPQFASGIVDAQTVQSHQIGGNIQNMDNQERPS